MYQLPKTPKSRPMLQLPAGGFSHVLVTGAAGFIGAHVVQRLASDGVRVTGLDNLNDYYDPELKRARLRCLEALAGFEFIQADIADRAAMACLERVDWPDAIVHLAAQAGVRYSISNPQAYIDSNVVGFANILEFARHTGCRHLLFASSSSVYGINHQVPYSTADRTDSPVSLYAATKKSNELMAHTYAHLFRLPVTGLRFFTVYGPWGRPDMAYYSFARNIMGGKPIRVFNNGRLSRDFTYISDCVEGIVRAFSLVPAVDPEYPTPFRVFNLGRSNPVELLDFIRVLEHSLGKKAIVEFTEMQPGDVHATYADMSEFKQLTGYAPSVDLEEGIPKFISWFRQYTESSGPGQI